MRAGGNVSERVRYSMGPTSTAMKYWSVNIIACSWASAAETEGQTAQLMSSRFSIPCSTAQLSRFPEGLLTLLVEVVGKVGEMNALCGSMAASSRADCVPWASGTRLLHQPRPGRMALSNG